MSKRILAGAALAAVLVAACAPERTRSPLYYGNPPSAAPAAGVVAPQPTRAPARAVTTRDITRPAADLPGPLTRNATARVRVDLETKEVTAQVADGITYTYWTFNGSVPGPFIRIRVGDTVELHLKNAQGSTMPHSIDLHAVTGPGGGAAATQTAAGQETMFRFKAINPGLYVYHCATGPIPVHIANGMYGLILVEPERGLPKVDREYYVMQAELYTTGAFGAKGHHELAPEKLDAENPSFVLFNGRVGALTEANALKAKVGEKVRIFFGVGGFLPSSFHVIGEIFDSVYPEGAMGSEPQRNVQTTLVPAGGATVVEFAIQVPGRYLLVDHTLPRALNKGAVGYLEATGDEDPSVFEGAASGAGH